MLDPDASGDRGDAVTESVRLLLVDDESLMRAGLRLLLDGAEGLRVVGEARDGREAAELARELRPDVVLMDIRMPEVDGIEGCRLVRALPEPPQVLMLTAFDTDAFILDALEAGAVGFLLKDTPPRQLVSAVQEAARGQATVSPSVLTRLIAVAASQGRRRASPEPSVDHGPAGEAAPSSGEGRGDSGAAHDATRRPDPLAALSGREREIAEAVARGLTNTEIAAEMFLSVTTVKTHVASIFAKLGVTNRVQVAIRVLAG